MPASAQHLTLDEARNLIASRGFAPAATLDPDGTPAPNGTAPPDRLIGVELESFLAPARHPGELPDVALPAGSRLTFEPGGQVELSSPPGPTVATACASLSTDLEALGEAFSPLGVHLVQSGLAPGPAPLRRLIDAPRYRAMEAYFDTSWPDAGREMMCGTAALQVNLGLGGPADAARRWRAANRLGPVLAAAFSTSSDGRGAHNRRLATWLRLDPGRTGPIPMRDGDDPGQVWADYALDANVMLIKAGEGYQAMVGAPITAREWVERGHRLGWPTEDDLAYHLTTLFPPVRPRGWLELRMIDALPDPWWRVPVAAAAVLLDDDDDNDNDNDNGGGGGEAAHAVAAASTRWWQAAYAGLHDPIIGPAAAVCAERTLAGLDRAGADGITAMLAEQWAAAVCKGGDLPWI